MQGLTVTWMNRDGIGSAPFDADCFRTDPLGYLDALRRGGDMEDLRVTDTSGVDVTRQVL